MGSHTLKSVSSVITIFTRSSLVSSCIKATRELSRLVGSQNSLAGTVIAFSWWRDSTSSSKGISRLMLGQPGGSVEATGHVLGCTGHSGASFLGLVAGLPVPILGTAGR